MRKRMDEKLRKKYSKIYAYNINNQNLGMPKQIAFKNLDKDFYEDIINSDLGIKKIKKNLEGIKDGTIKESVYTNREIPDVWKTKLTYRQEVHDAISNDDNFAKYIGSSNEEEKVDFDFDNKLNTFSSTYYTNENDDSRKLSRNNFLNFANTSKTFYDNNDSISKKMILLLKEVIQKELQKKNFFQLLIKVII